MPSHDNTLEEIKDRIDIIDLISEYVSLKKAGQNWKGLCPFHTEKTPSFTVSPAKQIYHCFGCGNGGDIFSFLVKYENLSFPEAVKILAKKAGVTLKASRKDPAKSGEKETLYNINRDSLIFFQDNLSRNEKANKYLSGRGIGKEIQDDFALGYALNSWNALSTYLSRKGYKPDVLRKAGLVTQGPKGTYDTFRDRIMFPIYDLKGDVVAFGGRSIDGADPKYINSPETPIFNKRRVLYGLNRAKDSLKKDGFALFMEGYIDVITAHHHGFTNAVAALGTAFTQDHGQLLRRFVDDVVLVFDSDASGIKAAKKAAGMLLESGLNVKTLFFPEKEDPDSFLRSKGKEAFRELLKNPLSIIDFIIKMGGKKHEIADEILEIISRIPNEILQDEYIITLSEKLNVNEQRVRERFRKVRERLRTGHVRDISGVPPKAAERPFNEEVYVIKLLLQMPERIKEVAEELSVDDFKNAQLREIYRKLTEGSADFNDMMAKSEGEEKNMLARLSIDEYFEHPEKVLSDCIKRLNEKKRGVVLQELQGRIRDAESKKDFALLKKLLKERQDLSRGKK